MVKVADRVQEQSSTSGIAAFSLGGVLGNARKFNAVFNDQASIFYFAVEDQNAQWEGGQGTYDASNDRIIRDIIRSSSTGGSKIDFVAAPRVFSAIPAPGIGGAWPQEWVGILSGIATERPAAGVADRIYLETDTGTILRDDGTSWSEIANVAEVGPEGSQGPQGLEGPAGPEGPQGPAGEDGATTLVGLDETPSSLGASGQILTPDGSGNLIWLDQSGSGGGDSFAALPTVDHGDVSGTLDVDLSAATVHRLRVVGDLTLNVAGLSTGATTRGFVEIANGGRFVVQWTVDSGGGNLVWTNGQPRLRVPYPNIETLSLVSTADFSSDFVNITGLWVAPNGGQAFICSFGDDKISRISMTGTDFTTGAIDQTNDSADVQDIASIDFNFDGSIIYYVQRLNDSILTSARLGTAFDLTTLNFPASVPSAVNGSLVGLELNKSKQELIALDGATKALEVHQFLWPELLVRGSLVSDIYHAEGSFNLRDFASFNNKQTMIFILSNGLAEFIQRNNQLFEVRSASANDFRSIETSTDGTKVFIGTTNAKVKTFSATPIEPIDRIVLHQTGDSAVTAHLEPERG